MSRKRFVQVRNVLPLHTAPFSCCQSRKLYDTWKSFATTTVETELLFMNKSAVDRIGGSVTLTLQCASAVYHTSGTRLGTGGFSGEYIWTKDSSLRRPDALTPASLSAKTKMKSDGATVALW